jgi:hypothetical protein
VRAYEKKISDCKRLGRSVGDTQKIDRNKLPEPTVSFDGEELVDQTEEANYDDQF